MIDYGNMDREIVAAVQANQRAAEQVQQEARKRISPGLLDALLTAETRHRDASQVYSAAQMPPQPTGNVSERAMAGLVWRQALDDARTAFQQAEQTLQRARAAYERAERDALTAMLHEAEIEQARCEKAVRARIGDGAGPAAANAMLAVDPGLASLVAAGRRAGERVALLTKAARRLYG